MHINQPPPWCHHQEKRGRCVKYHLSQTEGYRVNANSFGIEIWGEGGSGGRVDIPGAPGMFKKKRSLDMVGLEFDFYGVIDVNGIKCMSGFGKARERKSPGGRVNMD